MASWVKKPENLQKFFLNWIKSSCYSSVVEHMPCHQEVSGVRPIGLLDLFSSYLPVEHSTFVQTAHYPWKNNWLVFVCTAWGQNKLLTYREIAKRCYEQSNVLSDLLHKYRYQSGAVHYKKLFIILDSISSSHTTEIKFVAKRTLILRICTLEMEPCII